MKAQDLEQVIQYFDAQKPLAGQALQQWFIQRPGRTRQRLGVFLRANRHSGPKTLLIGHRGSGKSTELNKLKAELNDIYEPIFIDVLSQGTGDVRYEDLMLTLGIELVRACLERKLLAPTLGDHIGEAWQPLRTWWQELVAGSLPGTKTPQVETYAELSFLLGKVAIGAQNSSYSREQLLEKINRQMPELINHLGGVIKAAEAALNPRRLLLVVEGTDKIDLASARHIFFDHARTVTNLKAAMIYTFPLALYRSGEFDTVRRSFNEHQVLHNIAPYRHSHHAGSDPDPAGMAALSKLVRIRLQDELIADQALDLLVRGSGGVLAHLVRLVSSAALNGLTAVDGGPQAQIDTSAAEDALRSLRDDLSASLSRTDWQTLAAARRTHRLTNDAAMQPLLFSSALVEYTNAVPWCDAHPALWPVLDYYATDADRD